MRGARLHRSVRISRGHEITRTQGQRRKLDAENERSDLERLSAIPRRFSRGPSVQRRLSSRRHGVGFTRSEPRVSGRTNRKGNTACSRSFKKRRTRAPAQLRATDRDQGGQHGRAAPLNAASLWMARRNQIAARHRTACRSRFAALDVVRRRSAASAPPLRVAPLCHASRLRTGGSGLRATVRVWVRRLCPKNGAG